MPAGEARNIAPRVLAHLGDAVFHLFERENEVLRVVTVKQMHERMVSRASAAHQADILDAIYDQLESHEQDVVRRARNAKAQKAAGKQTLAVYRKATAFEALLGYLYLTDPERLLAVLRQTRTATAQTSPGDS
jgi:ribonuclease-3 family protein